MEHDFHGPSYTIGIEEELMIVDLEGYGLVNAIESLLEDAEDGEIKPELMESVLEISTDPAPNTAQAGEQLRRLRARCAHGGGPRPDHRLGGHHPSRCGRTSGSSAPALRELVTVRFVVRKELIFGMHVHVAVDEPDKAIHVANGMRVHLAVLLALSANSSFWRADATGLLSSRTPIFRSFPRVGIPPHYRDRAHYEADRIHGGLRSDRGLHVALVRRAPATELGTVEVRVCDSQTRVEHTFGLAALVQAMVKGSASTRGRRHARRLPVADARREQGAGGPARARGRARGPAFERARGHQGAGAAAAGPPARARPGPGVGRRLEAIDDLLARGNGAQRQRVV